jgi:hypothetical protein
MEIFTLPRFTIERGIDVVYSEVKYLHCMLGEIVNKNIGEWLWVLLHQNSNICENLEFYNDNKL